MFAGPHFPGREAGAAARRVMRRLPRYDAGLLASGWTAWSWRAKRPVAGVTAGAFGPVVTG